MTSPRKTRKPRVRRVRRPREVKLIEYNARIGSGLIYLEVGYHDFTAKEARKLAAWLVRAASYLEQKQKGPK